MAILLLERPRRARTSSPTRWSSATDVKAMIEKVDFVVDDEAEAAGYDKMTTIIDIDLKDGRTISGRADFGKGSPANPDELRRGRRQVPRERRIRRHGARRAPTRSSSWCARWKRWSRSPGSPGA